MTTARQRHLIKLLEEKYGVVGRVAGRYVSAGLHVTMMHPTRYGPVQILVQGNGQKLAVEVVENPSEVRQRAELLVKKAELLKAKPVLVLYGDVSVDPSLLQGLNVKVKRVRA